MNQAKQHLTHRRGITLVDLLVCLGCCLVAVALILPGIQAAREEADLNACTMNLQSLGKKFQQFETARGGLPPRRTGGFGNTVYGGWGAQLLPYIDEKLAADFHSDYDFFDPINKQVVGTTIPVFICPAAPKHRSVPIYSNASAASANTTKDALFEVDCGPNDYISSNGFFMPRAGYGAAWPEYLRGNQRQSMTDSENLPYSKITDGLSNTILIVEKAGAPQTWRMGKKVGESDLFAGQNNSRGTWAGYGSIAFGPMDPHSEETLRSARGDSSDCSVNCNNTFGIYSFHKAGGNILLCDGSVRFVSTKLDGLTFGRLTTRDDGQLIVSDEF
jgi:prepilin-type processing-associated H-X9-DG protein